MLTGRAIRHQPLPPKHRDFDRAAPLFRRRAREKKGAMSQSPGVIAQGKHKVSCGFAVGSPPARMESYR